MIKILATIFGYGLLIYAVLVAGLFFVQRDLMYVHNYTKPDLKSSGIIGIKEINVQTADGLKLFGWYVPPSSPQRPVILWFHGNAGNVGITATRAIPYIKEGYGVLMAEYRGYASNAGKPSEEGIYADVRAFMSWLVKEQKIPLSSVILYGESIGSGPALQVAMENPGLHTLILQSPMTSAEDIATLRYPFMPVKLLLKDKYDNISKIAETKNSLILVHGDADDIIPYAYGKKLFAAAPEPKTMITIKDGGHNNLDEFDVSGKILSSLAE